MDAAAAMRRAIALARRGLGTTSPNPVVGCVLLDAAGEPVGEGWHERAGGPHAEVVALRAAGGKARGGTAVVTLEPCAHTGRTPACTAALVAAGIARVVYAVADPVPGHGGAGALEQAGVAVESGLLGSAAARANEAWLVGVRLGRPFVHLKVGSTLDGRVQAPDGTSRWITGDAARRAAHRLRAGADAVVVGIGTVLADDPELTARDARGLALPRQPLRVVVDGRDRMPPDAALLGAPGEVWVPGSSEVRRGAGGRVDLAWLLAELGRRGVVSVLLEGGPRLAGSFVAAGLVDRVTAFVAPGLLGAGRALLERPEVATLTDLVALEFDEVRRVGKDVRLSGRVSPLGR